MPVSVCLTLGAFATWEPGSMGSMAGRRFLLSRAESIDTTQGSSHKQRNLSMARLISTSCSVASNTSGLLELERTARRSDPGLQSWQALAVSRLAESVLQAVLHVSCIDCPGGW